MLNDYNNSIIQSFEPLNQVLEGKQILQDDLYAIFESAAAAAAVNTTQKDTSELFRVSRLLCKKNKKDFVTFSKKAFFNLVNLCKDTCSYCTYKAEPHEEAKLSLMSKQNVVDLLDMAKKYHCVEALFVTGESPEQRYSQARDWLKQNGFSSTVEYIVHASQIALEKGLFPHTNAGNLSKDQMADLQKTNVSMGVMVENTSDRLTQKGMPHHLAASKKPKARLEVLKNAGELKIPMTTGVLVGIGETPKEAIDSIIAIRDLHERYGNIQEVILQNFQPKADTMMGGVPGADQNYFKIIVALTRIIMPEMNIQVPPNLSPGSYQTFLKAGINDWGGISPLTPDYVNPEFAWPKIKSVQSNCKKAGYDLKCRFPVYPEFFSFVDDDLKDRLLVIADDAGYVKDEYWRP